MIGGRAYIGLFSLIMSAACVDPLAIKIGAVGANAVVVEGYITDQPGPYEVRVSRVYNIDSAVVKRIPIDAKRLTIFDDTGYTENLYEVSEGVYRTAIDGIQGTVGHAYKLRVELNDDRIYETSFDTLHSTGFVQDINYKVVDYIDKKGVPGTAFDVYFNAYVGENGSFRYLWKTSMTYMVHTNPEDAPRGPLECSGYIINPNGGGLLWVKPCTCCFCWIAIDSQAPVVSDEIVDRGTFSNIKAGQVPATAYTMSYKTHVEVSQYSLSKAAYEFWKGFRSQKDGVASLFQPSSGKVIGNWTQVAGKESPIFGLFYASAVTKKSLDIDINDLPDISVVPPIGIALSFSCLDFDFSTNIQPDFWN